jgi:hypothetical protein
MQLLNKKLSNLLAQINAAFERLLITDKQKMIAELNE